MTRATWMVAKMAKTAMENQKPSLPEFFTGVVAVAEARGDHLEAGHHVVALIAEQDVDANARDHRQQQHRRARSRP